MYPAAGVTTTRPTTMAVAPPTAVTRPTRTRSISVQVASVAAGARKRVRKREGGRRVCRQGAARIEPEPAEPQQPGAQQGEGDVVGQHRVTSVVFARAHDERRHQCGRRRVDVHDGAAGKIERAGCGEKPTAPHPVSHRRVHAELPQDDEREIGAEPQALNHSAGDQRCRDDRERALEDHEEQVRNGALCLQSNAAQARKRERSHHGSARGKGQRITQQRPRHRHRAEGDEAHHHRVERVLRSHHAAVEESQRRRHQEHERRGHQHPGDIRVVHAILNRKTPVPCPIAKGSECRRKLASNSAANVSHARGDSRRKSQAFAKAHSRSTVAGEIPSASAASSMLSPAKNRSSTTRHCRASIEDSASSA